MFCYEICWRCIPRGIFYTAKTSIFILNTINFHKYRIRGLYRHTHYTTQKQRSRGWKGAHSYIYTQCMRSLSSGASPNQARICKCFLHNAADLNANARGLCKHFGDSIPPESSITLGLFYWLSRANESHIHIRERERGCIGFGPNQIMNEM